MPTPASRCRARDRKGVDHVVAGRQALRVGASGSQKGQVIATMGGHAPSEAAMDMCWSARIPTVWLRARVPRPSSGYQIARGLRCSG